MYNACGVGDTTLAGCMIAGLQHDRIDRAAAVQRSILRPGYPPILGPTCVREQELCFATTRKLTCFEPKLDSPVKLRKNRAASGIEITVCGTRVEL